MNWSAIGAGSRRLSWQRARNHSAGERYSQRSLGLTALLFVFLAAATIAVSFLNF